MPAIGDHIIILRADLPRLDNHGAASAAWWDKYLDKGSRALTEQGDALYHLARSEQLLEQEAEAERARNANEARARNRRRDELTREFWTNQCIERFGDLNDGAKRAIDRIIELEQA